MSKDIGYNSDIKVAKRKLHVQTSYLEEEERASVEIFEGGTLVSRRYYNVEPVKTDKNLSQEVDTIHELVKSDIELLFKVAPKVRARKHLPAVIHLGKLFLQRGFYNQAIEFFRMAKKIDKNADVDFYLGQAFYYHGNYEESIRCFQHVAENANGYPDVHLALGKAYWKMGNYTKAIEEMKQAIELNPDYSRAEYFLGLLLVDSCVYAPTVTSLSPPIERLKKAETHFKKSMRMPGLDIEAVNKGLEILKENGGAEKAYSYLEQAAGSESLNKNYIFDSEFYIKFMFGDLYKDDENLEFCIQRLQKLLDMNPNYADLRHSLGIAYLIKGWHFFGRATDEFHKAVEINPDYDKASKKLKLMQNDGKGLLILLRAILN